jgi:cobalt/nickel transport system permease protein
MLPEWYNQRAQCSVAAAPWPTARAGLALRRAVAAFGEALAREVAGAPSRPGSWLSRLDARSKTAAAVVLIVVVTFLHSLWLIGAMLAVTLTLSLTNGIDGRRLGRVLLGAPLFSLLVILPATLNLVTDGPPLLALWHPGPGARFGPWELPAVIAITRPGVIVAARFLLRVLSCLTLAFLLVATTGPDDLLNGLRRLGMPRAFGMVLTMMQRYVGVLLRAAQEIHLAKISRSIAAGPLRGEQAWVAAGMGSLFRRTRRLAEEVHEAMLSRGYDGDLQVAAPARWGLRDGLLVIAALLLSAALLLADRLL